MIQFDDSYEHAMRAWLPLGLEALQLSTMVLYYYSLAKMVGPHDTSATLRTSYYVRQNRDENAK